MEMIPKIKRMPIFRSATCKAIVRPKSVISVPQGITALVINAVNMAIPGPRIKSQRSAFVGVKSSFMNILTPSAIGCRIPNGPARSGPTRS